MSDIANDLLSDKFILLRACCDAINQARRAKTALKHGSLKQAEECLDLAINTLESAHEATSVRTEDGNEDSRQEKSAT